MEESSNLSVLERYWFIFVFLAALLISGVGVFWIFNQRLMVPSKVTPAPISFPSLQVEVDTMTSALEQQDTSDEITAIEADLEATDLSEIDKELADIEEELSSP